MVHTRLTRLILTLILVPLLTACGSQPFGVSTDDAAPPRSDGGALPDATVPGYNYLGWIALAHGLYYPDTTLSYGREVMSLQANFRSSSTIIDEGPEALLLETPDGVPCKLIEQQGFPVGFDEAPSLDVGDIRAWAGPDAGDTLAVAFDGEIYPRDNRNLGLDIWPSWIHDGQLQVLFQSTGGQEVPAFDSELTLPALPTILAPESSDEPLPPGPDGMHNIAWGPVEGDKLALSLWIVVEDDSSRLICNLEPTRTSMLLPHAWIEQDSSGSFDMLLTVTNERTLVVDDTEVTLQTIRATNRIFNVLVSP